MFNSQDIYEFITDECPSIFAQGEAPTESTDYDAVEFSGGCDLHEEAWDWQGMLAGDTVVHVDEVDEDLGVTNVDQQDHHPYCTRVFKGGSCMPWYLQEGETPPVGSRITRYTRAGDDVFPDFPVDEEFEALCLALEHRHDDAKARSARLADMAEQAASPQGVLYMACLPYRSAPEAVQAFTESVW